MRGFSRGAIIFLSTGGGSGYAPFMPGTAGTAVGVAVYVLFSFFTVPVYLFVTTAFVFLSILVSHKAEQLFEKKDPPEVVIDEIAGYLVTMATFPPDWIYMAAGFVFFRIMDIAKPYPAGLINSRTRGGMGIVLDDIVAGVYANLLLQAVRMIL